VFEKKEANVRWSVL